MATKLCTPIINEILSNLSTKIYVSNCVPGATVFIRSLTRPGTTLVKSQIAQPDGYLNLEVGVALATGDLLVASQSDPAGNGSPETAPELAVKVGAPPTKKEDINPVDIAGRVWQCGRHVYVGGAEPGATIELLDGGVPFANGVADGGVARFGYNETLNAGQSIEVRQRIGALLGPDLPREVEELPMDQETPLPAPVIVEPLMACRMEIRIEGVYEGSEVTLTRKSGEVETAPFDLSGLWVNLATPLSEANGWVKARQDMPACRRLGQDAVAEIGPPQMDTPLVSPLCTGTRSVFIDKLEKGAEVHIAVGPDVYVTFASSNGHNRFDVDPLPQGTITIQSFFCGGSSDIVTATVDSAPAQIDAPMIVGPLVKCQRSVTIEHLKPGATVQIWAQGPSSMPERPISQKVVAYDTRRDIDVTTLIEGENVWAVQWACALARRDSDRLPVWPAPAIDDPAFIKPVTRIDKSITVEKTVRDAKVEIRRQISDTQWELIGMAVAKSFVTVVALQPRVTLAVGQVLQARQRYCSVQTRGRSRTTVVKPVPLQPVLQSPKSGQLIPYGTSVNLVWSDPATGGDVDRKAESFEVKVVQGSDVLLNTTVASTTATLAQTATALYSTAFIWTVVPRNTTGAGSAAQSSFMTPKAPDPSITAVQDKDKIKVKGSGFAASRAVDIKIAVEYSAQLGSPNGPVQYNDNRFGNTTVISNSSGAIDESLDPAQVLEPRTELTDTGSHTYRAPPRVGAEVRVSAQNQLPISPGKGSSKPSNEAKFTWSA
jgi:hypothetical protein